MSQPWTGTAWFFMLYFKPSQHVCQGYLGQMPEMSPGLTTVGQYVVKVGHPKVPVHLVATSNILLYTLPALANPHIIHMY